MNFARSFPGQQPNEKIILLLHRHWAVLVKNLFVFIILAGLPAAVFILARDFMGWDLAEDSLGYVGLVMGGSLYYLFLWNLAFSYWLDYLLDYCVITDQRLVDVQQSGLFNRTVAEQELHRVQDVTTEVHGMLQTMMGYGNVYIQTAAEKERFVFEQVPHPEEVAKTIQALAAQHPQTVITRSEAVQPPTKEEKK